MKVVGIEPGRVDRTPDEIIPLLNGEMQNQGFVIRRVEIRQYLERKDDRLGDYSLLTVLVETDQGIAEMKYDEGYKGHDALESAAAFLTQYSGLAALINRALIELQR